MTGKGPLDGLVVVDFSQGIAGPYCGRLLADQGARVIKIEPPAGDWMRALGQGPEETSASMIYYNLGKESVVLDLKDACGQERALALAARADVVIESGRPGVTEKLGLGFEAVRARNPGVVYLSVSGFGREGPRAGDPMTDTVGQAFSGWMSINRGRDGIPHKTDTTIVDAVTGLYGFQAVVMALWPGARDGSAREARHLDVSLMQAAAAILGPKIMETAHLGAPPALINAPAGTYRTRDGWIAVTLVREAQYRALVEAIGAPELAEDPRFADFPARARNVRALMEAIEARLVKGETADWVATLTGAGVLASPINDFADWLAEPQVEASRAAPRREVLPGATLPVPRSPGGEAPERRAPRLGEHTEAVLREFGLA